MRIYATVLLVFLFLISSLFSVITFASAEDLIISDNSSGSKTQILTEDSNYNFVQQQGLIQIQNNIKANADTGNNKNTGNTGNSIIQTGNATIKIQINNQLNNNFISSSDDCCQPPPAIVIPPASNPSPSPSSQTANIAGNGGGIGGETVSPVLGLSATDGPEFEKFFIYIIAALCLLKGLMLLRQNPLAK